MGSAVVGMVMPVIIAMADLFISKRLGNFLSYAVAKLLHCLSYINDLLWRLQVDCQTFRLHAHSHFGSARNPAHRFLDFGCHTQHNPCP